MPAAPARCQLYLAAPAEPAPDFAPVLGALLEAVPVACLSLPPLPAMKDLANLAQARGTAVVLREDFELASVTGADGVHLGGIERYGAARRRLGPEAIVGVACGGSRHAAMEAGEAGADYVALAADLELIGWWAELMVVPVVAELGEALDMAGALAAAGADFVAAGEALWRDPASALAAAKRLAAAISAG
ncbi:MAG TPA: thiamine phosphate synthase [Dongiaceae bacterium]|nr:thiamine phosphate synthase [Dongiaceae bacterium]